MNEGLNTTDQNLQGTVIAVLSEIHSNQCLCQEYRKPPVNGLTIHLRELTKLENPSQG